MHNANNVQKMDYVTPHMLVDMMRRQASAKELERSRHASSPHSPTVLNPVHNSGDTTMTFGSPDSGMYGNSAPSFSRDQPVMTNHTLAFNTLQPKNMRKNVSGSFTHQPGVMQANRLRSRSFNDPVFTSDRSYSIPLLVEQDDGTLQTTNSYNHLNSTHKENSGNTNTESSLSARRQDTSNSLLNNGRILQPVSPNALTTGSLSPSNQHPLTTFDYRTPHQLHRTSYTHPTAQYNNNSSAVLGTDTTEADMNTQGRYPGRMTVRPVGNDAFSLSVEDTGINPTSLQEQMKARNTPNTPAQRLFWETPGAWNNDQFAGTSAAPTNTNTGMPGFSTTLDEAWSTPPFVVMMPEHGLPRINMMGTPWLSNTLGRHKSANKSTVANEYIRPASPELLRRAESLPPRSVRQSSTESSQEPVAEVFKIVNPPHQITTGHQQVPASSTFIIDSPARGLPLSTPGTHSTTRINAPKAIDVTQVPAAGMRPVMKPIDTRQRDNSYEVRINHQPPRNQHDSSYDKFPVSTSQDFYQSANPPIAPPRAHRAVPVQSGDNPQVSVQRVGDDGEVPTFKIMSSAVPRFKDTLPRPKKNSGTSELPAGQSRIYLSGEDYVDSRVKSPKGYLQTFLREARERSPSPSGREARQRYKNKDSPPSRERGRQRSRDNIVGRSRSPSPMPEQTREVLFTDNIDWSVLQDTPQRVDWAQIQAVLSCGQDVQRLSVVTSLPHLLRDNRDECLRRVIPKIREFLPVAQQDMQLAASAIFLQILQNNDVPNQTFSQQFLPIILNSLDNKDPDVGDAWLETLLEVIPMLPKEILRKEVLGKAVQKGQISQTINSRLMSCRILGKVSICLESFVIKKEILPLVQSLCQDVEYEVRACMCRQLDLVAKGMGLESTKSAILPELVELANDEEGSVRLAGLDTVVSILSLLDDDTCTSTIIPLVVKFCQGALQDEDSTLPIVSKHFGKLCHGLSPNMSPNQKAWFLDYYKKLCLMGLEAGKTGRNDINDNINSKSANGNMFEDDRPINCRINAAFNFPAMSMFAGGPSKFDPELYDAFSCMCRDPSVSVRRTMAHGFHEVARSIGSHVHLLLKDLVVLFKDEYIEVLNGIVKNLTETVNVFDKVIGPDRLNGVSDLMSSILSCDQIVFLSNDWRLQELLMDQMNCLTRVFSSDHLYHKLVPLMFSRLHNAKALPVRLAAARTVLIYLRNTKRLEQRQEMCSKIISEFAKGKSYRDRTIFIDISMIVLDVFSKLYFKENFYEHVMDLSSDAVPNIRLRLCSVLPSLKKTIRLPGDRNLLQQLESHVRKLLINERDRDVLAVLKSTVEELDRINCAVDSMHSRRNATDDDVIDHHKEEFEHQLIEQEERERREEEAEIAASGKKKSQEKKSAIPTGQRSKGTLDKTKSTRVSKIPTVPQASTKEPRRSSIQSMKDKSNSPVTSAPTASQTSTGAGGPKQTMRATKLVSSGGRTVGSANSVSSGGSISSAGSIRSGRSSGFASPVSSAGIRRRNESIPENKSRSSVTSVNRKNSKDGMVYRKQSH